MMLRTLERATFACRRRRRAETNNGTGERRSHDGSCVPR